MMMNLMMGVMTNVMIMATMNDDEFDDDGDVDTLADFRRVQQTTRKDERGLL
jgi:hypothetical protein